MSKQPQANVHFTGNSDDMIAKYAKENPQAAADYNEVMSKLMQEFVSNQKEHLQKLQGQASHSYDTSGHTGPGTNDQHFQDNSYSQQQFNELSDDQNNQNDRNDQNPPQYNPPFPYHQVPENDDHHPYHQPPENDRFVRDQRSDQNSYDPQNFQEFQSPHDDFSENVKHQESRESLEARLRDEIRAEFLERREEASKVQWGHTNKKKGKLCLPYPGDRVCDLNIIFMGMWVILFIMVIFAFIRTDRGRKEANKKTTQLSKTDSDFTDGANDISRSDLKKSNSKQRKKLKKM